MPNLTDKQRTLLIAGVGTVATATMQQEIRGMNFSFEKVRFVFLIAISSPVFVTVRFIR